MRLNQMTKTENYGKIINAWIVIATRKAEKPTAFHAFTVWVFPKG